MAHSVWNGTISLGLLAVKVKASKAADDKKISFNMVHACQAAEGDRPAAYTKISQKTHCDTCAKQISRAETVKGYAEGNGAYLIVTEKELDACEPKSNRVMNIEAVVNASEVDPVYFDKSYHLEPGDDVARQGYRLLADALRAEGKVAVSRVTMSSREHVVIVRPYGRGLMFHTCYFPDEVAEAPSAANVEASAPAMLELARQLLVANEAEWNPGQYADGYRTRVVALLEAKRTNTEFSAVPAAKPVAAATDLMAALAASLVAAKPKKTKAA